MPRKKSPCSKRIRWEEDEAYLLADACIKVHADSSLRASLVDSVSSLLRHRAKCLGMQTPDSFRNENGIRMQMIALEREMYSDARKTWHSSALFREVGEFFRSYPKIFCQKLTAAKNRWMITPSPISKMSDA